MNTKKKPNTVLKYERQLRGWSQQKIAEKLGTSEDVISRWERGERAPSPYYQEKLCQLFDKPANELGLIESKQKIITARPAIVAANPQTYLTHIIQPSVIMPEFGILDRLDRAFASQPSIDISTIEYLKLGTTELKRHLVQGNQTNWNDMLIVALNHLGLYTNLIESNIERTDQLTTFLGENCLLVGDILFNLRDGAKATRYYEMALRISQESHNIALYAIAAGRYSLLLIDSSQFIQARQLLTEAIHISKQNISSIVLSWLCAVQAEAYAHEGDIKHCYITLEAAKTHLTLNKQRLDSYTFIDELLPAVYGTTKLLGFEGSCYLQLNQPDQSQQILTNSLKIATHPHHQSLIHIDFARSFILQKAPVEACASASNAIISIQQTGSVRAFQRILSIRQDIRPWEYLPEVKALDQQIKIITN